MNRFYKGYDDITASEPFKQRMVRTLQSETKGETAARSVRLPIKRRTLAILIAAAILVLAIGTAAAATIIGKKYYSPSAYLMNGKDEREQNEQAIPDIENAIASAKPEGGETSIVMLPEMENADELNAWRQKMGQPVYSEEDWGWIREIRPEIEEVLVDGNMLVFNIRMHTDHGMSFDYGAEEQRVEAFCEDGYYTVDGDETAHEIPSCGGGTNPDSVTSDGATMHTEIELDDLAEPFPTEGIVHVTASIHIRDTRVEDMNDIGLLALMTYEFSFDASAGADVAAPTVTERPLSGSVVLTYRENGREYNKRVSLDGVVLEETTHYRSTGIYVTYKVKSAPEGWTDLDTGALMSPSYESSLQYGISVVCAPKGITDENEILKSGYPNSVPGGEYTVILPIFPSDYERIKATGYEIRLGYRRIDTFNDEPVGEDWQFILSSGVGEWDWTSVEQPIASFDLQMP